MVGNAVSEQAKGWQHSTSADYSQCATASSREYVTWSALLERHSVPNTPVAESNGRQGPSARPTTGAFTGAQIIDPASASAFSNVSLCDSD